MHIVVIGSGVAGISFAEKYRALSADDDDCKDAGGRAMQGAIAEITLVTREHDGYYSRPLLSRGFTRDDIEQSIILKTFDKLRESNINVYCGAEVTAINRSDKTIAISGSWSHQFPTDCDTSDLHGRGECRGLPGAVSATIPGGRQEKSLQYDKLVLAQGSSAFIPPPFRPYSELFFCLNSLTDLKTLRKFRQDLLNQNRQPDWAIIGGGLIGCEVASDLAIAGDNVTLFHAMDRLMERQLAAEDSVLLNNVLKESGVKVLLNQAVQEFVKEEDKVCVRTDVNAEFDGVIVACGFKPRTELAELAGLETGRGIKVNQYLQTSDESIYALGDVAELPDGKLYAFILPIRNQAHWLAGFLAGQEIAGWTPPVFTTKAKVHGFEAVHPYNV
ncbi:MAG: FAD-dependent oxidoreductase [Methylobacter sp.]|jgi:NAD(P)H-nitrite reductase large subunit